MAEPSVVNRIKAGSRIRASPAGMEMNCRTAGINLPKKVDILAVFQEECLHILYLLPVYAEQMAETAVGKFIDDGLPTKRARW